MSWPGIEPGMPLPESELRQGQEICWDTSVLNQTLQ
jgi:hypothetical protein